MTDAHANLAISSVVTPPAPAATGTTLIVTASHGSRFPATPFNATVWAAGQIPDPTNAEIVRVTGRSTDTLTIVRGQESTSARAIVAGDQIMASITVKTLTDIEGTLGSQLLKANNLSDVASLPAARKTLSLNDAPGIFVPPGWGQFWKPKRDGAFAGQLARVAIVGDSIASGLYASNLLTKPWTALLAAALKSAYADGGSGFDGCWKTAPIITGVPLLQAASQTYYAGVANNEWALTGTWGMDATQQFGPGYYVLQANAAASTITRAFNGTSLTIFYINGGPGFTYKIDGGTATTVNPGGAGLGPYTVAATTKTGLAAGAHTLVITTAFAGGEGCYICGLQGSNGSGVRVDNYSIPGIASGAWNNAESAHSGTWVGGWQNPCELLIYAIAANDADFATANPDAWIQNIEMYLSGVLDTTMGSGTTSPTNLGGNALGNTDLMFVLPHIGQYDIRNEWGQYRARLRGLAESYGAAIIDVGAAIGRNSWNYWNSLAFWGSLTNPAVGGTDSVHPNDAGHAAMEALIMPYLQL